MKATSWETGNFLEGRIGLNKFFKLMKITQIPKFNSRISSKKLRDAFSKEFKELSSKIVVDQKLKKLSIRYIQVRVIPDRRTTLSFSTLPKKEMVTSEISNLNTIYSQ
jgi:chemotaxis protein CheY-P-specific phosphatase CheC